MEKTDRPIDQNKQNYFDTLCRKVDCESHELISETAAKIYSSFEAKNYRTTKRVQLDFYCLYRAAIELNIFFPYWEIYPLLDLNKTQVIKAIKLFSFKNNVTTINNHAFDFYLKEYLSISGFPDQFNTIKKIGTLVCESDPDLSKDCDPRNLAVALMVYFLDANLIITPELERRFGTEKSKLVRIVKRISQLDNL